MGIRVEQIEQAMMPVAAQIPLDEQVVQVAANHGAPFIMRDRSRPVSQGIIRLAEYVRNALKEGREARGEEEAVAAGAGRPRLSRVFG
jgi:MinD-like ATPase involved in chromosome partitioning or flagellar assembly